MTPDTYPPDWPQIAAAVKDAGQVVLAGIDHPDWSMFGAEATPSGGEKGD